MSNVPGICRNYLQHTVYILVAPKYWNNLPDDIRDLNLSLDIFKKQLKT